MFHVERSRTRSSWDVIVIGGGHAGCEAAAAAARMGASVALVTMSRSTVGAMSCNPAIGGIGKGHLVREVDACDGIIGKAADAAAIHYRMLNSRKGKAVQGPRVQADRLLFRQAIQRELTALAKLDIVEADVERLLLTGQSIIGIETAEGGRLLAEAVVIATGTFLGGRMFCGSNTVAGGRSGDRAATALAEQLRSLGLPMARLKTGTPPRLDGRTIDWSRLRRQASDGCDWTMSPLAHRSAPQLACALTRTNGVTHRIVRDNLAQSPLHSGAISGRGPRYCPSIEDKVQRFADRDGHQIFLEPEGLNTSLVYPNGISTSLPARVQLDVVNSIAGLESARVMAPGYAVEYDHIDPRCLDRRLALRDFQGLYFAGQVNGTTGYEEAAAQGLVAGLNAAAAALEKPPVPFERDASYIGVLVDDLTLHGVSEPYRMLTARAEHRLHLRADNAERRLTGLAITAGCLGDERLRHAGRRAADLKAATSVVDRLPASVIEGGYLAAVRAAPTLRALAIAIVEEAIEDRRYAPYVARQRSSSAAAEHSDCPIAATFDYRSVRGLSNEMLERLEAARPASLRDAARIQGVTPAALSALLIAQQADVRA